jgi:Ice-binding-like
MIFPTRLRGGTRTCAVLAIGLACIAAPAAAQAGPVLLGTTTPFVVLAGSTATNTGPSVLNGDLGVSPGTALVGFGLPAVVNGATHATDAVAAQAQLDLTTAYNVAAGQPVLPANDLSGTDLGNRILKAGAYRYTSSALLTGPLTLDAEGDPNAQFVFEIASSLTTASASSVVLLNGASPCNVFWQVGASASLGTTTAFQGNLMADQSISLDNGATVIGRLLARIGAVTLINNVLDNSRCNTGSTSTGTGSGTGTGTGTGSGTGTPGAAAKALITQANQASNPKRTTTRNGTTSFERTPHATCTSGFRATVHGKLIKRVVFTLDGNRIKRMRKGPFLVFVRAMPGAHRVSALVTFKDATKARTLRLGYRACADAVLSPTTGPSAFTG